MATWKIIVIVVGGLLFLFVVVCVIIKIVIVALVSILGRRARGGGGVWGKYEAPPPLQPPNRSVCSYMSLELRRVKAVGKGVKGCEIRQG